MVKSIRFSDELAARVQAQAVEWDRSFSYIVVRAVEDFLAEVGPGYSPEARAALKAHWDDPALTRQFLADDTPVEKEPEAGPPKTGRGASPVPSPASSRQAFKCPDPKCGFRAFSAKAVCGNHGRMVVPA